MLNNQIYNELSYIYRRDRSFSINTEYEFTDSIFDRVISSMEWLNIIDNKFLSLSKIPSNISIISSPLEFSQKKIAFENTLKKHILFFHIKPYNFIKKEDILILDNALKKHKKICFSEEILSWNLSNNIFVNYGVPNIKVSSNNQKSILVLNLTNNQQTVTVYNILKSKFKDTDILYANDFSLEELYEIVSSYKICIDFDSYYNLIFAGSCGSYGIGVGKTFDPNIITIRESNDILGIVPKILENYSEETAKQIKNNTIEKYNFDKFNDTLNALIYNISLENVLV